MKWDIADARAADDPLPSWKDEAAKRATVEFVQATTEVVYCLDRDPTWSRQSEAEKNGWVVISMKKDWKHILAFGQ